MTGREWKPGTMARTQRGGTVVRTATGRWILVADGLTILLDHEPRPLVVIDTEDREQVRRLYDRLEAGDRDGYWPDDLIGFTEALREFANPTPPKPAEPTGLGAVVQDANGVLWVRDAERHDCWFSAPALAVPRRQSWADTDAVKVLSEGVTA